MKSAIIICTLAIFGICLAEDVVDPLEEARDRAMAATTEVTTKYAELQSDPEYTSFLTKFTDLQSSIQLKIDEANEQIRTPYNEFYMALYSNPQYGTGAECFQIATLNLNLDVYRSIESSYQTSMTYSQIISDLQTLANSEPSDKYYTIFGKLYNNLYDENITVEIIDALILQFEQNATKLFIDTKTLFTAIKTELENLEAKLNDDNSERVQNALNKLESIKQAYESCLPFEFYK